MKILKRNISISLNDKEYEMLFYLQKLYETETVSGAIIQAIKKHKNIKTKREILMTYPTKTKKSSVRLSEKNIKYVHDFMEDNQLNSFNLALYNIICQIYNEELRITEEYARFLAESKK